MAIEFIGQSGISAHDANGIMSVDRPSGVLQGDAMFTWVNNWNGEVTAPSGWTKIFSDGESALNRISCFWKVAGTSEPTSYSWNSNAGGDVTWNIITVAYRGCKKTKPYYNWTSDSHPTSLTGTPSFDLSRSAWIMWASGVRISQTLATTAESTLPRVERRDNWASNGLNFVRGLAVYDSGVLVSPGTGISRTITRSKDASASMLAHCWGMVALDPEPDPVIPGTIETFNDTFPSYPASQRFHDALLRSHTVVSYVDVKGPTGIEKRLTAVSGSVDVDRDSETRRRCTVECIDPTGEFTPNALDSILTPYGTEIRPYRGIRFPDGTEEVVPLGVFRIAKVEIDDSLDGLSLGIEAFDLSRTIARDKFTAPYTIAVSTNIVEAIQAIARRTFPEQSFGTISTSRVVETTLVYDTGDDPWEKMQELATTLGCDIYFDVDGRLNIIPMPNIDLLPSADFSYIEGKHCTMLGLSRVLSDDPGYNGVVVIGESPGDDIPPVQGIAWDEEPTSVTYRKGPYGEVPMFTTDQLVKTEQEAKDLATSLLQNQLGFSSQLEIDVVTNPLFECGTVIAVKREQSVVDDVFVLDSFNVPLGASSTQGLTLRQRRLVT